MTDKQAWHLYLGATSLSVIEPYKTFADGTAVWCYLMMERQVRVCIGHVDDKTGFERAFCYATADEAFAAVDAWDGTGEPQGWYRSPTDGRRRRQGDASREYILR
jgi:hypothetical protein